jgi:ribosomal protein S14
MFNPNFHEKYKRTRFSEAESFIATCLLLKEVKYTPNITYLFFKRQVSSSFFTKIKNRCILTKRSKSVRSKFRYSRIILTNNILQGNIPGFYRAI